jgi:CBS domain-containing protein
MTKELVSVGPEMDTYDAISRLLKNHVSAMPVVDEDGKLAGILSERDCLDAFVRAEYYESPPALVKDLMTTAVVSVGKDTDILKVAETFSKTKFHHLPVLENDQLVGQISRKEVIRAIQEMRAGR